MVFNSVFHSQSLSVKPASVVPSGTAVEDWSFEYWPQTLATVPWAPTNVSFADQHRLLPVEASVRLSSTFLKG